MPIRLSALAVALAAAWLVAPAAAGGLDDGRKADLGHLLRNDCGACHGLTLNGGLGPALTPERLEGRSVAGLTEIIMQGVPGTPMPPWGRFLEREEAAWLARQLKEGPDADH